MTLHARFCACLILLLPCAALADSPVTISPEGCFVGMSPRGGVYPVAVSLHNAGASVDGALIVVNLIGIQEVCKKTAAIQGFPEQTRHILCNIIAGHHGKKENGSPVEPLTPEAQIVSAADQLDVDLFYMIETANQTQEDFNKVFALKDRWETRQMQSFLMAKMQPYFDAAKASQDAMILQRWHEQLRAEAALRASQPHVDSNLPQAVYMAPHAPLRNGR